MRDDKRSPNRAGDLASEAMEAIAREGELLEEISQEEVERRKAAQRRRLILLAVLLPVLVVLTALNLLGYGPFRVPVEEPSTVDLLHEMRAGASYAVDEIVAFQEEFGRLPETLEELGAPDEGFWTYELLAADHYRLTLTDGDFSVSYDSRDDPDIFFADVRQDR